MRDKPLAGHRMMVVINSEKQKQFGTDAYDLGRSFYVGYHFQKMQEPSGQARELGDHSSDRDKIVVIQ